MKKYQFKNITISGLPGSGSTTLLQLLKEELKYDGWTGFSGGEFMRKYAVEKGLYDDSHKIHHDASAYGEEFDRQIDFGIREKLQDQEKWIIESWISGFFAQGLEGVCKVLVVCSDDAVRVDRIVNRDEVNAEEAKKHIHQRYQVNFEKWSSMYRTQWEEWVVSKGLASPDEQIDFWKPDLYDVVIDTYSHNQKQTLQVVLDAIKK
ncbi:MAG TPA: AAA family ATPase [Candidatus Woesebacteria bacterium]|nr:AAA family ATPase [Candidatus Woesebacteria bacterium]